MVACCMIGCSNRTIRDPVSFYRFPRIRKTGPQEIKNLLKLRRNMWLTRVGRQDLFDSEHKVDISRVCSKHFIHGRPATLTDIHNPDWAPTIELGHNFCNQKSKHSKNGKGKLGFKKEDSSMSSEEREESFSSIFNVDGTLCNSDSGKEENSDPPATIIYLRFEKS